MDVFYNGYFKGKAHELLHNPHEKFIISGAHPFGSSC